MTELKKRAAIYMRVSTVQQEEEQTIENQRIELLKRIEEEADCILLPECIYMDDGWSGAILERPALDQLRTDAKDGKFDILYFYDRGRVARRFVYQEIVFEELRALGIEFISLHDINGKSAEEALMGSVMGIFAEYERVKIAERMRIGKFRKVRENKKLLGYLPKYGYEYIPRIKGVKDGKFVINEEQAEVVRLIFEWANSGMSKYAIREELYKRSIMPIKGKKDIWSLGVIDRLLRDTTYMGDHYYNKTESVPTKNPQSDKKYQKTAKGSRVQRPKEEWLKVDVDPIVSKELFSRVQEQLARNKRARSNNKKHDYLVAGVVECICGYARTGEHANKCLYYRCTDRLNNAAGTRQCYEPGVNAVVLDNLVWRNIKKLLTQPELLFEQAKRWQEGASPLKSQLETLHSRLSKLNDKESRYFKMYGEEMVDEQTYKDNMSELNKERTNIVEDIRGIEAELANKPSLPLEKLVAGVIKLTEDLDFEGKRQIIQKLVTKVVATKEEVTVWGYIPILATEEVGLNVKRRHCRFA